MKLCAVLVLCGLASAAAFAPAPLSLRPAALTRSSRSASRMSLNLVPLAAFHNALLLADIGFDSDGSKTDRLYNGIPVTGAVEAPPYALPLLAVAISLGLAVLIPLILKPGTDAFNEGRTNAGIKDEEAGGKKKIK
mmetsp:Transcript_37003/g.91076  ORF Transcript_37003/g.91076 Transcript_37003/m.91076 type:complete len:136 (+) Transcript_37003:37-444(+)|eukprot:CAMPEP_0206236388 /NCGR_PEP_ID=MMETSP0047_2-20121206/13689_1 /ASSEMBLY_ACC=CAM_ASM_000192 /TAXON_ID=195065 /ORGANISM="Chroomonas mesostigmatica_cf, Strain CCMP1168" /LENGTH=135 /DNA_ID=CAMNT_0053660721 /DNA_START=30 /DNA_END=437 /DNA_ORIENTATION=-